MQHAMLKVLRKLKLTLFCEKNFLSTFAVFLSHWSWGGKLSRLRDFPCVFQNTLCLKSLNICTTKSDLHIFLVLITNPKGNIFTLCCSITDMRWIWWWYLWGMKDVCVVFSCPQTALYVTLSLTDWLTDTLFKKHNDRVTQETCGLSNIWWVARRHDLTQKKTMT